MLKGLLSRLGNSGLRFIKEDQLDSYFLAVGRGDSQEVLGDYSVKGSVASAAFLHPSGEFERHKFSSEEEARVWLLAAAKLHYQQSAR